MLIEAVASSLIQWTKGHNANNGCVSVRISFANV